MYHNALGNFNQAFSTFNQNFQHQNAWINNNQGHLAGFNHAGQNNRYNTGISNQETNNDEFEKYVEHLKDLKEREEKKQERKKILNRLLVFTIPLFVLPRETATFFIATELLATYLELYGLEPEEILIIFFFIHALDFNALVEGKFRFLDDYKEDWFADTLDYTLIKYGVNDLFRILSTLNVPHD